MQRTILSLTPFLLAPLTAAQCEIARPGEELPSFYFEPATFAGSLVALGGNGDQVYLYEPQPAGWTNTATLAVPGAYLAESPVVYTDGQRVLVGMVEDGGGVLNVEGRVYVYEQQNGVWQQTTLLQANNPEAFDTFGSGIAMAGNVLVVGASQTVTDVLCGPGKSFVFEHDGNGWVEVAEFLPHGQMNSMGGYGFQIDTDGQTAVIGAHQDDGIAKFAGAVYVYRRSPVQGWIEEAKLVADVPTMSELFGSAVAIDGNRLYVGAPGVDEGTVYVYQRQPSGWQVVQVLKPSNGADGDNFGASLALDGNRLVVGSTGIDVPGTTDVGGIYAFERQGGVWQETAKVVADDAGTNHRFGMQVSLVGNQILWAGSYWADETRLHSLGVERQTNYCATTPNSSGTSATISADGCDSILGNALTLTVTGAPANEIGAFLYSNTNVQIPFGNGFLCVAGRQAVAVGKTDGSGAWTALVDFTSGPLATLTAGDRPLFQTFFRDTGFGAGFGTSNGLAVFLNL